jgi:glycerophosphoryl diester phosphodiesterase
VALPKGAIVPGTSPPVIIAHGGGNSSDRTAAALAGPSDYLEVDFWVHGDRFEARHERRFPFGIPFLYEKWYLRRVPRDVEPLERLLEACEGRAGIFLDLKNGRERPSRLVAKVLEALDDHVPVLASSQQWDVLRGFAANVSGVPVYYSVDVPAKLDLLHSIVRRDPVPAGTSCRHTLLTRDVIRRLHDEGLAVVAWTVDDPARAEELAEMGVDGITTHNAAEIRAVLGPPA